MIREHGRWYPYYYTRCCDVDMTDGMIWNMPCPNCGKMNMMDYGSRKWIVDEPEVRRPVKWWEKIVYFGSPRGIIGKLISVEQGHWEYQKRKLTTNSA